MSISNPHKRFDIPDLKLQPRKRTAFTHTFTTYHPGRIPQKMFCLGTQLWTKGAIWHRWSEANFPYKRVSHTTFKNIHGYPTSPICGKCLIKERLTIPCWIYLSLGDLLTREEQNGNEWHLKWGYRDRVESTLSREGIQNVNTRKSLKTRSICQVYSVEGVSKIRSNLVILCYI